MNSWEEPKKKNSPSPANNEAQGLPHSPAGEDSDSLSQWDLTPGNLSRSPHGASQKPLTPSESSAERQEHSLMEPEILVKDTPSVSAFGGGGGSASQRVRQQMHSGAQPPKRNPVPAILGVLAVLLLIGGAWYAMMGKKDPPDDNKSKGKEAQAGGPQTPVKQSKGTSDPVSLAAAKINPKDDADMILIPAGPCSLGDAAWKDNPPRKVTLPAYYIYKNLVTVKQYRQYCQATGRAMPPEPPFNRAWQKEDHPIVNINWQDAVDYCKWAGGRLPKAAEWEKAARGTDGRKFPWGSDFDGDERACSSIFRRQSGTCPAGSHPQGASPYGVLDMAGNVWQWCQEWYDDEDKEMRGGSWDYDTTDHFQSAFRDRLTPITFKPIYGIRCVVDVSTP